ncbi:uncharacterized protein [Branchiostoma lanceolatum]|uniref:uncharacterized protein isoform X2 n=1 Tax=Branchiostoma lanceolatum TaxID=7740 RepID=UPI0034532F89
MGRRDKASRQLKTPTSLEDIEASWSRKPQQYEAKRKKEKSRQNSMACYHVVVMVLLFILTAGIAYLVYNGTDTSAYLRSGNFDSLSAGAACAEDYCMNGGNCIEASNGYLCMCMAGWTGARCETEMFCTSQPCNNGICLEGANGFYCFCEEGWDGKQCDADIDECKAEPCGTNGQCNNSPGSYNCSCIVGFSGVPCKDVDECQIENDCDGNATCTNTAGSYSCRCNTGFTGDGHTCEDEDECASAIDRCPNNYECFNTPGGFFCGCNDGYTDTGTGCVETTTLSWISSSSGLIEATTLGHETTTLTSTAPAATRTTTSDHETTTIPLTSTASDFTGSTTPTQSTTSTPLSTRTTTASSDPTTAEPTTLPVTTVAPTTPEPTSIVSWMLGDSVTENNITEVDGTTITIDSGWKVSSTMEEEISDAANHTGLQCWYYKSGWNSGQPGGGTPFSPGLNLTVGRSDGSYNGDVDSFYASFWFKMAKDYDDKWGDGTRIMVVAGDPDGTTAASNHLEIYFPPSRRALVSVRTKESHPSYTQCAQDKDCGDDFGYTYTNIADDLDPTTWHHVQMTLRTQPQDYADEWSYLIDNTYSHTGGAFYKTGQYDESRYLYVNRLNFASLKTPSDSSIRGIYFDDIIYKAFNSSDTNLILDEYSTSFEP